MRQSGSGRVGPVSGRSRWRLGGCQRRQDVNGYVICRVSGLTRSRELQPQKITELEDFDAGPSAISAKLAEDSRPRRQFKEDQKAHKKPQGRKRKAENTPKNSKKVNWMNPLLWPMIELAAVKAGKPWKPSEICRQARLLYPDTFRTLTEQVVGRWIDTKARDLGIHKWKDEVLAQVPSGAAPGGQSTRAGVLVS